MPDERPARPEPARPKFDPKRMAVARAAQPELIPSPPLTPPAPPPPTVPPTAPPVDKPSEGAKPDDALSVSAVAQRLDRSIRAGFPASVRVRGEVSGFRDRTHWYFDLKDADAVVSCAMFASVAKRAPFRPENGQSVIITAKPEFYAPGGKVTFVVTRIEPAGAGTLAEQLKALVEELRALGWLDPARKRRLPVFPRRVAVVTSRTGAALADVLVTMNRRCPAVGVLVADVRVQGEGAAPEIARAIRSLSRNHARLGVDAIVVTRGGGSMEDLWCFNDREVARAIVECAVPVVAAIGHETDTTLAELVADERAATPTQAAMRVTPDSAALARQLTSLARRLGTASEGAATHAARDVHLLGTRLVNATQRRIGTALARLDRLALRVERQKPQAVLARMRERLSLATSRLARALPARLAHDRALVAQESAALARASSTRCSSALARLDSLEKQLRAVGPESVLNRGFSVTLREDGGVVRAPGDVRPGQTLTTRLAGGSVRSVVEGAKVEPLRPAKRKREEPSGPGLFGGE
ncbi:MAG: exodeoxyribonuclease VII large subunit [Planctomycetota bacterium]|nr:exodeoxyribonuclease VII large subunit [Planctomycetota bacterium]